MDQLKTSGQPNSTTVGRLVENDCHACGSSPQPKVQQKNMDDFSDKKSYSVIEAVNWSCIRILTNHERISKIVVLLHKHDIVKRVQFDIDVPW